MRKTVFLLAAAAGVSLAALPALATTDALFDEYEIGASDIVPPGPDVPVSEADTKAGKAPTNPDYSVTLPGDKIGGPIASNAREFTGSLTGRIVYLMAGHGWSYDSPGIWYTQRSVWNDMVEDMGNLDQASIMADMLLNAGATVVPLRPFGHQVNEVVIDNDDAQVAYFGAWSNSSSTHFYGTSGDVPYRFATGTTGAATATATYNASALLPEAGFYPVYTWTRWGTDRINQEYIIGYTGGAVSRRVNHQRVGSGWVYLGTYYFEPGGQAYVQITNVEEVGEPGSTIIADAIRFGNGMGDVDIDGEVSGKRREEENGRYWLVESRGTGSTLSATNSVNSPPYLAEYMNYTSAANSGDNLDRIYFSFHSNGGNGSARGADGLFNTDSGICTTNPADANSLSTTNGPLLAQLAGTYINTDMTTIMSAVGNPFEFAWGQTGAGTNLYASGCNLFNAFGEIRSDILNDEMAATIIETAFHDNTSDAALMIDPKVREALARACYHAIVDHFSQIDAGPTALLPEEPTNPYVVTDGSGNATLRWTVPVAGGPYGAGGDAPAGYVIYVSDNGYGFEVATTIANGATTSANVTAYAPAGQARYFRVAAYNAGGESFPSQTVAVRRSTAGADVLIVNGFDRYDKTTNHLQYDQYFGGAGAPAFQYIDRVVPRFNNSFDYCVEHGEAIAVAGRTFDTCQNDQIVAGTVLLSDYDIVVWIFGRETSGGVTLSTTEQTLVTSFLSGGGNLFLSGTEVAWDLGRTAASTGNKTFLENTLHVTRFASGNPEDDSATYQVQGSAGGIFAGISAFNFSDGTDIQGKYDADYPDILVPFSGSQTAMTYVGGPQAGSSAAIVYDGVTKGTGNGRIVFLGFPFEAILSETVRNQIMTAAVDYLDPLPGVSEWHELED